MPLVQTPLPLWFMVLSAVFVLGAPLSFLVALAAFGLTFWPRCRGHSLCRLCVFTALMSVVEAAIFALVAFGTIGPVRLGADDGAVICIILVTLVFSILGWRRATLPTVIPVIVHEA